MSVCVCVTEKQGAGAALGTNKFGDRSAIFFSFACFLVARRSGAAAVFPSGLSHVNTRGRSGQDTLLLRPTSRKQIAVVLLDMPSRGVHV